MTCPAKPDLALRISVTDRCSLRCVYCMPSEGVAACAHEEIISFEEIVDFVRLLSRYYSISKVRLTGGDPLARKGIVDLVAELSQIGVEDLALTTNGQQLRQNAGRLKAAGLNRVNISLDSIESEVFRRLSRGGDLSRTIDGIDAALEAGLNPVKLNMVVLRGENDTEVCSALSFAMERSCELRFLELMPIGYGSDLFDDLYVPGEEVVRQLRKSFKLVPAFSGPSSTATRYHATGLAGDIEGYVGFITSCSSPFCSSCNRLRITARGALVGCLARSGEVNVRHLMRSGDESGIVEAVRGVLKSKRMDASFEQSAAMSSIGG